MKLIIEDDEGRKTVVPVVREEITIGRQDGNTIRLTERNVSRRHARFFRENGSLLLEDLNSYNGVRVNGERIGGPTKVKEGDLIEIGDYDLGIQGKLDPMPAGPPASAKSPRVSGEQPKVQKAKPQPQAAPPPPAPPPQAAKPKAEPKPEPEAAPAPAPEPVAEPAPAPAAQSPQAAGATAIIRLSDLAKPSGPVEVRDLAKNEMPRLVGLNGAFRGKELYFQKTEIKFGRTDDNDLAVDHQSISRQHGKFVLEEGGWKVYDNKSANGVRINNEDYAVSALKPGDTVELGHVKFRFCAPGERFTPPAEPAALVSPSAGAAAPRGGAAHGEPATAPIAGMRGAPPAKSKMPLIAGGIGAVVVIAIVAVMFLRGGGGGGTGDSSSLGANDAISQGDKAFAGNDYLKAVELYEVASGKGTTSNKLKKAKEEAPAQQAYNDLQKAIASSDFDKAKAQLDVLQADPDKHWAKPGIGKADQVKAGYIKKHLDAAKADPAACSKEAGLALQMDPGNEEAQKVSGSCGGGTQTAEVRETRREPKAEVVQEKRAPAGPSQDERNAAAAELNQAGNKAYTSGDPSGAVEQYSQALKQKPKGEALKNAYRGLGTAYSKLGDKPNTVKFMKLYLPMAPAAEKPTVQKIIDYYSK